MNLKQVQPQDATFLYVEDENTNSHVTVIWIYGPAQTENGRLSLEDIQLHLRSRLHVANLLHQRLVRVPLDLDYPYWVDAGEIDLADHVWEHSVPAPGGWRSFCQLVSELHSQPLDLERPLWEMHLVQGLRVDWLPEGAFALVAKIHHVAMDGAAGMAIIQGLHDPEPKPITQARTPGDPPQSSEAPGALAMWAGAARNHLNYSLASLRALAGMAGRLPTILSTVRLSSLFGGGGAPYTLFNRDVSPRRVVDCRFFEFQDLKKIQKAVPGVTINDVVLTICAGALRRFMESQDQLPEESMVVVCPINVRTGDDTKTGGNRIAMLTTAIHTDIAHPVERLKAVHRSTQRAKAVVESIGAREIHELNNSLPSTVQTLVMGLVRARPKSVKLPRPFNTSVSNLPGPRETLYLGGARLLHIGAGMPIGDGYGLFLGICSYGDKISFNVTSAHNILPRSEKLMVQFEHALAELKVAAGVAEKPAPRRKKSATGAS